jgi:hypothetical protein
MVCRASLDRGAVFSTAHQYQSRRKTEMTKQSSSKEKAAEGTMVLCPKCGASEFTLIFVTPAVNVYCTETEIPELRYVYEMVNISQNDYVAPFLKCKKCYTELSPTAA